MVQVVENLLYKHENLILNHSPTKRKVEDIQNLISPLFALWISKISLVSIGLPRINIGCNAI
jgi:hypothetical protein